MQKEIPILFSTAMVQAILEGRKTQKRRVVKPQPNDSGLWDHEKYPMSLDSDIKGWYGTTDGTGESRDYKCPFGKVGNVLWVRETWARFSKLHEPLKEVYEYKADKPDAKYAGSWDNSWANNEVPWWCKWRPSIHMPKDAARIWLEVTGVRVERLQDISDTDVQAEGVLCYKDDFDGGRLRYKDYMADASGYGHPEHDYPTVGIAKTSFCTLWGKINGRESWDENPWVWVIEFKVLSTTGKPVSKSDIVPDLVFEEGNG